MSTSIYLVASPLQMLYALEARLRFPAERHVLCVLDTGLAHDRRQIDELAAAEAWTAVHRLPWPIKRAVARRTLRQLLLARRLERDYGTAERLFSGDYSIALNALVPHSAFYLLSDGNKIVWQHRLHGREYVLSWTRYDALNRLIGRLFPWMSRRTGDIRYFSPFEFPDAGEWMITHDFAWLRRQLGSREQRPQPPNTVYFFGAYLSEGVWTRYTTEDYFLRSMERIGRHYAEQGARVIYIPHRHEDAAKLERLRARVPGLEIDAFERGIELEFLRRGIRPTHVASFVSTALYNVTRIYPQCRVDAFQLDPEAFLPKQFWSRFVDIYEYYAQHMNVERELLIDRG